MTQHEQADVTILIADDHPMVRAGLRSMLNAPDIRVVAEAESGQDAIDKIMQLAPDIALLDIRMPDLDGIAALEALNEAQVTTRMIMVTTYRNTAYLLRALAAGAAGFVLKDIGREGLLETVRRAASGTLQIDRNFLQSVLQELDTPEQSASAKAEELVEPLSPREMDVLRLLVEGLSNQAIAGTLCLSPGTVKGYVQSILQKLNASARTEAAVKAIRMGIVQ